MDDDKGLSELVEGLKVETDEQGRFTKVNLSPDRARLMSALSRANAQGKRGLNAEEISAALIKAQSGEAEDVGAVNDILLSALGVIIAQGKANSLPAIESAAKAVGGMISMVKPPGHGQRCHLCGTVQGSLAPVIVLSREGFDAAAEQIKAVSAGGALAES